MGRAGTMSPWALGDPSAIVGKLVKPMALGYFQDEISEEGRGEQTSESPEGSGQEA